VSATHKIAHKILREPQEVVTLYRVGVWAVHESDEVTVRDLSRPDAEVRVVTGYVLTHTPSGLSASAFRSLDDATAAADMLGAAHGDWAQDAPLGEADSPYWAQHADVFRDIRLALAAAKMVRLAARHAAKVNP
jgi:hypothetical protein